MMSVSGKIIRSAYREQPISFFVTDENDVIQSYHSHGLFYEPEELAIIERHFPKGGVFLDVGSNVGNHAIFASKFLYPSQVIVIEPNPRAIDVLMANIDLNAMRRTVDTSLIGIGLSNTNGWATANGPEGNLGATHLSASEDQTEIRLARGDDMIGGRKIDFIKIDVEGMEILTLEGLRQTIAAQRPIMFVEVDNYNHDAFMQFVVDSAYTIHERFRRYEVNENFLIIPAERSGRSA